MRLLPLSLSACLTVIASCASTGIMASERPSQLLLVSFDGAGPNHLWQRSRDLGRNTNAHFTYFLSCTLLIPRADAALYQGPGQRSGKSNIGFAQNSGEARLRLGHIWAAQEEGHEIASHTCGHFDGKAWSETEWESEFASFSLILKNAWKIAGATEFEPNGWKEFVKNGIKGFRAPYFSTSASMTATEKKAGFTYDASLVTKSPALPEEQEGLLRFGLPLIPEGPSNRPIIAMDYNLFVRHSGGIEDAGRSAEFEERAYAAFRRAFDGQYNGARIPLQIGLHFVEMNGGAYWRAMERLVREVCGKSDVACVTYTQAISMLTDRQKPRS